MRREAAWLAAMLLACGSGSRGQSASATGGAAGTAPQSGASIASASIASAGSAGQGGSASGGGSGGGSGGAGGCAGLGGGGAGGCYANACAGQARSLQENRDRLIADLAKRKCTDSCALWAALNQGERYVLLMDTAYLAAPASRLYPPSFGNQQTALDHALALYSINGPQAGQGVDGSGRGGLDYNRIYLGFDAFGACVMRHFPAANPTHDPQFNRWVKSDDLAGPHKPFTQREMIFWYKPLLALQSDGPQFHHWAQDADFTQAGIDQRLGVCGVSDRTLTELTIAFDVWHNSDPLGDYAGDGGYGWQIVDKHAGVDAGWNYQPTGCPPSPPVNTDPYGGGTFAGMGPIQQNGACVATPIGNCG